MNEIILKMIEIQTQLRIFHWQTKMYGKHIAYGSKYDAFDGLIDTFAETVMGKMAGERLTFSGMSVKLADTGEVNVEEWVAKNIKFLENLTNILDNKKHSDLLNIRDEMMQELNQLNYLLTLK